MADDEHNDEEEVGRKLRGGESSAGSIDVGRLLRAYRERANFTQQELAARMGIAQGTIAHLEDGTRRCSRRRVTHIAQALSLYLSHVKNWDFRQL